MKASVITNSIGELNALVGQAQSALSDIEVEVFGSRFEEEYGGFENPQFALEGTLEQLHDVLLVILDAAELQATRTSLMEKWDGFVSVKGGLQETLKDHDNERCFSHALGYLQHVIKGLKISATKGISSNEAVNLRRLEEMLRDTAGLVHRRNTKVASEADVQRVMHDYLSASFHDFTKSPQIGGTLKNFKPDCGIRNIGAAIEFKYVPTKELVAVAVSGVTEDTAGYKGSKDWTRFYAVIYLAQPFMLESHLRHDLKRIGAATWTPIVVNGPAVSKRKRQTVKAKRAGTKAKSR